MNRILKALSREQFAVIGHKGAKDLVPKYSESVNVNI